MPPTRPGTEYPGVCCTPQATKEKSFVHRAAGMMQKSYRQWKEGQGITEVFLLVKEEVTSGANPSSHRYSSLPARLTQSRAGSCVPEPPMHTFLALHSKDHVLHHTPFPGSVVPDHHRWKNCLVFQCLPVKRLCLFRATHSSTHCLEGQSGACSGMSIPWPSHHTSRALSKGIDTGPQHPSGAQGSSMAQVCDRPLSRWAIMSYHQPIPLTPSSSSAHPNTTQIQAAQERLCLVLMHIPLARGGTRPPQGAAMGIHPLS